MIETAKNCEKSMIATSIITMLLGLVLIIEPSKSIQLITIGIAIVLMAIGLVQIYFYIRSSRVEKMTSLSLVLGVMLLAIGLYLMTNSNEQIKVVTRIIGLFVSIKSLFKLQYAVNLRGISPKWKYNLIAGLLYLSLGIIIILEPTHALEVFLRIIGGILIVGSIAEFVETIMVLKTLDNVNIRELPFIEKEIKEEMKKNTPMEFTEAEIIKED